MHDKIEWLKEVEKPGTSGRLSTWQERWIRAGLVRPVTALFVLLTPLLGMLALVKGLGVALSATVSAITWFAGVIACRQPRLNVWQAGRRWDAIHRQAWIDQGLGACPDIEGHETVPGRTVVRYELLAGQTLADFQARHSQLAAAFDAVSARVVGVPAGVPGARAMTITYLGSDPLLSPISWPDMPGGS